MRKKWIFSAAALLTAASVSISACSGSGTSAPSESAAAPASSASAPAAASEAPEAKTETPPGAPDKGKDGKPDGAPPEGGKPQGKPGEGGGKPGGPGGHGPGGGASKPDHYDAVGSAAEDKAIRNQTIRSESGDENAVLVENGASVTLFADDISRVSDTSSGGDSASFYGVGAAVLVSDGTVYVDTCDISTDAKGGAGVFAYDKGTAFVSGTKITTEESTSGGLHAAGGGTLYAWDCDVTTKGESAAAIRSDRGGTMVIEDGEYVSNGQGSPAVYSTADITAAYADLKANGSEAVCIEGENQLRLYNCNLSGNMADLPQNGLTWNVILYQSMSGDSKEGNSLFEMNGGILEAKNGGMFYTTNTQSTFVLKHVDIRYAPDQEFFLRAAGNSNERGWGQAGKNGAQCSFTALDQEMRGDVQWDSISTLHFYMKDGSTLTGAFVQDETDAGSGGDGYAELMISKDSSWYVTGDSTVTKLHCAGTIEDTKGNPVTIRKSDGTVLSEGSSEYTVTVEEYDKAPDFSGASEPGTYESFRVEKPAGLH